MPTNSQRNKKRSKQLKVMADHMGCLRVAPPKLFLTFLKSILHGKHGKGDATTVSVDTLARTLNEVYDYTEPMDRDMVLNAINDGLIKKCHTRGLSTRSAPEYGMVRLPKLKEVKVLHYDYYCFECHTAGIVEKCTNCDRSFHAECYRKNVYKPLYNVPSAKNQKHQLPLYNDEDEEETEPDGVPDNNSNGIDHYESPVSELHQEEIATEEDNASAINSEVKPNISDVDIKMSTDVIFVGEVRPPARVRPSTAASAASMTCKNEPAISDSQQLREDLATERRLCTCCRLMKNANLRQPPNMKEDELCYLLRFTFDRNRSWVSSDVETYLRKHKFSEQIVELLGSLLLKQRDKTLAYVAEKIDNQRYSMLMEFFCDILDVQHNIGVVFGIDSNEFEETKWLVRDLSFDLGEISNCPDCFRYSNEKGLEVWFAKPCRQRHELVYAKHMGHPYWPAKIMRALKNNKYDVRFFGSFHTRALVTAENIKSLDEARHLKLPQTLKLKKAKDELLIHQSLLAYPYAAFSFYANKEETEHIIGIVMNNAINNTAVTPILNSKRTRKRKSAEDPRSLLDSTIASFNSCHLNLTEENLAATPKRVTRSLTNRQSEKNLNPTNNGLTYTLSPMGSFLSYNELLQELQRVREENQLKDDYIRTFKTKRWCRRCLRLAYVPCCFNAAYCTKKCKLEDYKHHKRSCNHKE